MVWPASVPGWLRELWHDELVNIPHAAPQNLFNEAAHLIFHRVVAKPSDSGCIRALSKRQVRERLASEREFGSYREPRKNIYGEYC